MGTVKGAFMVVLMVSFLGVAACGDDDGDGGGTTAAKSAEPILIKTRVDIPTGKVLGGSSIGGSPFCPGGTFRDKNGSQNPSVPPYGSVDRTFSCRDGSLRIGFSPGEPQKGTQFGPWKVAGGTGALKGLRGGGRMKVTFESGSNSKGRETFTGKITR